MSVSEYELDKITNLTGCLKPCRYTQYSLVGDVLTGRQNSTSMFLQRPSSTSMMKREILGLATHYDSQ